MAMNALRNAASGGLGKFILFGFLVLAVGGLVFSDVGGFFRGGVSSNDVAKIGDRTISIYDFDRTVRRSLAQLNMTTEQAYEFGYLQQILANEVRGQLMAQAAEANDIKFSRQKVGEYIHTIVAPMIQDGQTANEVLDQLLRAQNMSEAQLTRDIHKDLSVEMLSSAVAGGFAGTSKAMATDLAAIQNETRDIEYTLFAYDDFKGDVPAPSDEELQNFYDATKEAYAIPEERKISLITLKTDALEDTIEVTDEEVRAEYDNNIERFEHPETRAVEQTILQSEEDAQKIADMLKGGKDLKTAVNEVTGNTTDYIPAKDVDESNLLEELADPIFTAEQPGAIGPIQTALGYHVLTLHIKEPSTDKFEDVQEEIRNEIREIRLSDARYELSNALDDLLASGATPTEIKEQLNVEIKDIPAFNRFGRNGERAALKEMREDKPTILEAAFDLIEGESSAVFETANGKLAAVYLENVTPKTYQSFDSVKSTLQNRWVEDQARANAEKYVKDLSAKIQAESGALKANRKATNLKRDGEAPEPLTAEVIPTIFSTPAGGIFTAQTPEGYILGRVTDFEIAEASQEMQDNIRKSLTQAQAKEGLALFIQKQNEKYEAKLNERLLEQAYAPSR